LGILSVGRQLADLDTSVYGLLLRLPRHSLQHNAFIYSNRMLTSSVGKELSFMVTLETWNIRQTSCCFFHSWVNDALRSVIRLQRRKCSYHLAEDDHHGWQCGACGIMDEEFWDEGEQTCMLCGEAQSTKQLAFGSNLDPPPTIAL
jgi:hypothetical protein